MNEWNVFFSKLGRIQGHQSLFICILKACTQICGWSIYNWNRSYLYLSLSRNDFVLWAFLFCSILTANVGGCRRYYYLFQENERYFYGNVFLWNRSALHFKGKGLLYHFFGPSLINYRGQSYFHCCSPRWQRINMPSTILLRRNYFLQWPKEQTDKQLKSK
jgi:hypothetical protein